MNTKESRINETLTALDGIQRAQAPSDLFFKMQVKIKHPEGKTISLLRPHYWSVAAGIALLITLNVLCTVYYHHNQRITQEVPAAVAEDYLSYLGPIKL